MNENSCDCDFIVRGRDGWQKHYDNCKIFWGKDGKCCRNKDGSLNLPNRHLAKLQVDVLYHLGLDTYNHDLETLFKDIKFVCMGGTKHRMREFAVYMSKVLGISQNNDKPVNLTKISHRYAMYKVGPVLSVSHGIGIPSMTVLLQEAIKLLSYARVNNPIVIRIGTSGGLQVNPGTVVISTWGMNGTLEKCYDLPVLGKVRKLPSVFDRRLVQELQSMCLPEDGFDTVAGGTMAADDFYRGQARLDGPFCDHSEEEKMAFLSTLHDLGVRNIEMEATAFAALTKEAGIRAADVCVTLINRLEGDQIETPKTELLEWQQRPMLIVGRYIQQYWKNK